MIIQFFKQFWKMKGDSERPTKRSYIILIGLIGLLFVIISNIFSNDPKTEEPIIDGEQQEVWLGDKNNEQKVTKEEVANEIQHQLQTDMAEALEMIQGISNVQVLLQLDASSLKVYEKNTITGYQRTEENDQNGGTRSIEDEQIEHQTVLIRKNNSEEPLLIQTKMPEVRGVLIIAEGVDQVHKKQMVIEAVSRLLDVSTHRISVMPKDREE
ncbi:stage III sporulation protein AG [Bacillaceae bacterium W0354]